MKLYNSATKTVELFKAINQDKVMMYFCGPTTYNYAHIGNARPAVIADLLYNVLTELGYNVQYASNYTDIDDKIVVKAMEENKDALEVSRFYIEEYRKDLASLYVKKPEFTPKVSETMSKIIEFIDSLIKKGYAYEVEGDVYFEVDKIEKYGALSNQQPATLLEGVSRLKENTLKKNPLDFALWKKSTNGKSWQSPFSKGRPGWHSECVVMINDVFKTDLIDIHGGGNDLKFPHHENEVAQCRALYNTSLANYWIHNGMIKVDGAKMSKSIGNVLLIRDLVAKYGGNVIRWFILSSPYRLELILNEETLDNAFKECNKVISAIHQLKLKLRLNCIEKTTLLDERYNLFLEHLSNDLNVASANTILFDVVKTVNQVLRQKTIAFEQLQVLEATLDKMMNVLGYVNEEVVITEEIRSMYFEWEKLKQEKNFEQADRLRNELITRGVLK